MSRKASVLTVGQMINSAFGAIEANAINFKLVQAVLLILARQLRLLNRRIILDSDAPEPVSGSNLKVSELKLTESKKRKTDDPNLNTSKSEIDRSILRIVDRDVYPGTSTAELDKSKHRAVEQNVNKGTTSKAELDKSTLRIVDRDYYPATSTAELDKSTRQIVDREEYMAHSKYSMTDHKSSEDLSLKGRRIRSETTHRQQKYYDILERLEEQRERVLRVIHQRKNSYDEGVTPASPLASLKSEEIQLERLFMVENISDDFDDDFRKPFNIVTQEQYKALLLKVEMLEQRVGHGEYKPLEFPENSKLMKEIRSGASLCDAMTALQISARIQAAENTLKRLTSLLDEMRNGPTKSEATSLKTMDEFSTKSYIYVTKEDFWSSMEETKSEIMNKVNALTARSARALEASTNQVTNVQEQLNQVQIDLDVGIQNMTETLANKGVDTEMISELHNNFDNLQFDLEKTNLIQRDTHDFLKELSVHIERLRSDTELLRDTKCDREEFLDALRDKAGIKELNGMVSMNQHIAAYTSLTNNIEGAYDTFRKQEMVWQRIIDDINLRLDAKVKRTHMEGLREDIQNHLNGLRRDIADLKRRLGEPLAAAVTKKIFRDTTCVSCSNPANITPAELNGSILPPLKSGTDEKFKLKGGGDQAYECVPGFPGVKVIHPKPQRHELCTRYCGGSYTKQRAIPDRKTDNLYLEGRHLMKTEVVEAVGDDKKIYKAEEEVFVKPCIPCNNKDTRKLTQDTFNETLEGALISPMKTDKFILKQSEDGKCLCREAIANDGMDRLSTTMPFESLTLSMEL